MDIKLYQTEAAKTIVDLSSELEKVNNSEDVFKRHLENAAIGMSVESNEVLQLIQRYSFCSKCIDRDKVSEECGDVLWYISYLLSVLGVSLEECMKSNLVKVSKRYPERFNKSE